LKTLFRTNNNPFYGTTKKNNLKGEIKMRDEIKVLLEEEIKSEIGNLSNLSPGTEEHTTAIENLAKLYKLKIEETKNEKELSETVNVREMEHQLKREQLTEQVKDRYFRIGIDVAGLVLPLIFYASWMNKGFKFEETGTFTSTTFRGLFNRFRPSKN
jgi:hypothetical protein